jgi:hypothetical protein
MLEQPVSHWRWQATFARRYVNATQNKHDTDSSNQANNDCHLTRSRQPDCLPKMCVNIFTQLVYKGQRHAAFFRLRLTRFVIPPTSKATLAQRLTRFGGRFYLSLSLQTPNAYGPPFDFTVGKIIHRLTEC